MRPYGHDLVQLFEQAKLRGLVIDFEDVDDILVWINEWHSEKVKIRYRFDAERTLPLPCTLLTLAKKIISASVKQKA